MATLSPTNQFLQWFNQVNFTNLLSLRFWLERALDAYEKQPGHLLVEVLCLVTIVYLLIRTPSDPKKGEKMTKQMEEQLIAEWEPEPLCPPLTEAQEKFQFRVVSAIDGCKVKVDGKSVVSFASFNFLGLADNPDVKEACLATINKYGVGSCGPRGFYGSIDTHLELEAEIAKFLGATESILYSDALGCVSSVIPAFAKRGDLIICDDGVRYVSQQGLSLSRANVLYFKHNDMADLKRILETVREKDVRANKSSLNRRYLLAEGLSLNHGDVCPLDELVALAETYKYRVILDDSLAVGVLGKTGRGSPEHWGVPLSKIDVCCIDLDAAIASVGGICIGGPQVVDHQRLSGAGYCFSASSPPYVCTAATVNVRAIAAQPGLVKDLQAKVGRMREGLVEIAAAASKPAKSPKKAPAKSPKGSAKKGSAKKGSAKKRATRSSAAEEQEASSPKASAKGKLVVVGGADCPSPVIHLRAAGGGSPEADQAMLQEVADAMFEAGFFVEIPRYVPDEAAGMPRKPVPSLRVVVTALHDNKTIDKFLAAFAKAF